MHSQVAINPTTVKKMLATRQDIQTIPALTRVLDNYLPTSLSQMQDVKLLRRIDTKYVMSAAQLTRVLSHLTKAYSILEIDGHRKHHYQTLYFDTPDYEFYQQHHNGLRNRYKIRTRVYVDSDLYYLEIKSKTNKERTIKNRKQIYGFTTHLDADAYAFIRSFYPETPINLAPSLWNDFHRITLVSQNHME
jgi:hypothetical protein